MGIPLLLVTVSFGMNFAGVDEKFRPKFGGFRCWYTQRYAMLIYFGVPVAISLLLNTFFFVTTSWNLRRAFKNSVNPDKNHHFVVYVRLFIIMGITWIFGFISAFTDEFVVDLTFIILNALQGLFLFVSFVCNRSVLTEIRKWRQEARKKNKKKRTSVELRFDPKKETTRRECETGYDTRSGSGNGTGNGTGSKTESGTGGGTGSTALTGSGSKSSDFKEKIESKV